MIYKNNQFGSVGRLGATRVLPTRKNLPDGPYSVYPKYLNFPSPRPVKVRYAPFTLLYMKEVGGLKFGVFQPSRIREVRTIGSQNATILHDIYVGTVLMTNDPMPEVELELGKFVYVKYSKDKFGNIKTSPAPEIYVDTDQDSIHYQPADGEGSGGSDGTYYIKIGQLTGTTMANAKWVQLYNSDIEDYHDLWVGRNIGTGAGVFKQRNADNDYYEFRRINGQFGITSAISGDNVRLDFSAENIGSEGEPVYKTPVKAGGFPTPGVAQFRKLRELISAELTGGVTAPQVRVQNAGNEIRIRGNSYVAATRGIVVMDGLVTYIDPDYDDTPVDGWWGTVAIYYHPVVGSAEELEFFFENGRLITMKAGGAEVPGEEGAPGNAAISIYDTDT